MKGKYKFEVILLVFMWIMLLSSYLPDILIFKYFRAEHYIGIALLFIWTVITTFFPKYEFYITFFTLIVGSFNLAIFQNFLDITFSFGISGIMSPGIQPYSLILFIALIFKRKRETINLILYLIGKTDELEIDKK